MRFKLLLCASPLTGRQVGAVRKTDNDDATERHDREDIKMELREQGKPLRKALPLLLAATCSTDLKQVPIDYHQVKASYLFNLLRFIEWPDHVGNPSGILNLYVCGATSLDAFYALHGARTAQRRISVQRIKDLAADRISKCHILVISSDVPVMNVPIARGLLTVGETDGFTACGGVINLNLVDGRVRFQLNQEVAQACGLTIDPRLLNLRMR
jgi:hypothetical protein